MIASRSAKDNLWRYAGRSRGVEERESSSREDRPRSETAGFMGSGAITARMEDQVLSQSRDPDHSCAGCGDVIRIIGYL